MWPSLWLILLRPLQEAMQNQVNINAEAGITGGASGPQFIIQGIPGLQGGVLNLADLIKSNTGRDCVFELVEQSAPHNIIRSMSEFHTNGARVLIKMCVCLYCVKRYFG